MTKGFIVNFSRVLCNPPEICTCRQRSFQACDLSAFTIVSFASYYFSTFLQLCPLARCKGINLEAARTHALKHTHTRARALHRCSYSKNLYQWNNSRLYSCRYVANFASRDRLPCPLTSAARQVIRRPPPHQTRRLPPTYILLRAATRKPATFDFRRSQLSRLVRQAQEES